MTAREVRPTRYGGSWYWAPLVLSSLAWLTACDADRTGPVEPMPLGMVQYRFAVHVSSVSSLVVAVTAPDISDHLVYNLPLVNGFASGTLAIPAGSERTITVRAFDRDGSATHEGVVILDIIPGDNRVVVIVLLPLLDTGPGELVLGDFTVEVSPRAVTLEPGTTTQLSARVVDDQEAVLDVPLRWATTAAAVAAVDVHGLVSAVGPGNALIVATLAGVAGTASVTVVSTRTYPNQSSSLEPTPVRATPRRLR